jgi:GR25 family glycosyltransferase involved in LPS biosynthesis
LLKKYKSFLIHLSKIKSSLSSAVESKTGLEKIGIFPTMFEGTYGPDADVIFENYKVHPVPGIVLDRRKVSGTGAKGCFHSHYRLWQHCVEINEPIMIFEDDIVVLNNYIDVDFQEVLILSINFDWGPLIEKWQPYLKKSNNFKEAVPFTEKFMPGTSGYIIKPVAAKKLLDTYTDTYITVDIAMNADVIIMEIHPQLIGRSKTMDEKESLVRRINWDTLK